MPQIRVHALIDSLTWGGAESLLADLAVGASHADLRLTVGYLQEVDGSPNARRLRAAGIEPRLVGIERLLEPTALMRVRRQLQEVRPDIVHTHLGASDVHGTLAARSLGIPSVSTLHLMTARRSGDRRSDLKERLMSAARRHGSRRVITVSDAARDAYLAAGWDRPGHVVTVHNGIAWTPPQQPPDRIRAELGLDAEALVVAIVAVLRPGKGHEVLAEAARTLLPRFPQLRVLVIGDGPDRDRVERMFAPAGDAVLMLGHRSDVPELLAASDVLVHPTHADAFPTVLLEAGAAAIPVVATAVGGIPEIVADERSGLLIPAPPTVASVTSQLARLLADEPLRRELGRHARMRFEQRFTAERWAERLHACYSEVLRTISGNGRRAQR